MEPQNNPLIPQSHVKKFNSNLLSRKTNTNFGLLFSFSRASSVKVCLALFLRFLVQRTSSFLRGFTHNHLAFTQEDSMSNDVCIMSLTNLYYDVVCITHYLSIRYNLPPTTTNTPPRRTPTQRKNTREA